MDQRRNIFITGATTGIGLALAEAYLKEGHHVGMCGRDISKVPNNFKDIYPFMHLYQADVTNKEEIQAAILDFCQGDIDLIIANAGIKENRFTSMPDFDISRKVINTNLIGVINTFDIGVQLMVPRKKGHLVAIASVAGFIGLPRAAAYSASKAAVLKYLEAISFDLLKFGVNVTAIAPGFIDTPLTRDNNFNMPFLMDARTGAKKIKNAIRKKKRLYIFPFRMFCVIYILEKMPRFFYFFIMKIINSRLKDDEATS